MNLYDDLLTAAREWEIENQEEYVKLHYQDPEVTHLPPHPDFHKTAIWTIEKSFLGYIARKNTLDAVPAGNKDFQYKKPEWIQSQESGPRIVEQAMDIIRERWRNGK